MDERDQGALRNWFLAEGSVAMLLGNGLHLGAAREQERYVEAGELVGDGEDQFAVEVDVQNSEIGLRIAMLDQPQRGCHVRRRAERDGTRVFEHRRKLLGEQIVVFDNEHDGLASNHKPQTYIVM